jgi:hypothetical protein
VTKTHKCVVKVGSRGPVREKAVKIRLFRKSKNFFSKPLDYFW